jgi:hypothetical protein
MRTDKSWVAVSLKTGKSVGEFKNPELKKKLNLEKYKAVDILEYLQDLNVEKEK